MIYISREEAIEKIETELTTAKILENRDTAAVLEKIIAAIRDLKHFSFASGFYVGRDTKTLGTKEPEPPRKINFKDLINTLDEYMDLDIEDEATGNYISTAPGNSIIEKLPNGTVQKIEGANTITIKVLFDGGETWEK